MSGVAGVTDLILPALALGICGFLVPRLLAAFMPEGVVALVVNALVSTLVLVILSALGFYGLYLWQGAPPEVLAGQGWRANLWLFGRLGLAAALIWAPVMVLSLAGLPRRWKTAVW